LVVFCHPIFIPFLFQDGGQAGLNIVIFFEFIAPAYPPYKYNIGGKKSGQNGTNLTPQVASKPRASNTLGTKDYILPKKSSINEFIAYF